MSEQFSGYPSQTAEASVADDPSTLVGNVTPLSDDELYMQKIQLIEGVLEGQTAENLAAQRSELIRAVGGDREAERVDLWEIIKGQQASRASGEVGDLLLTDTEAWSKPEDEKDVFDRIASSVAVDYRGSTDPERTTRGSDIVDFNVGTELNALVDGDELRDPAVLAKATKTIRLLVAQGSYKLHQWGNGNQLQTALGLMKTYSEYVPGFDPYEAGLAEVHGGLITSLAALQVDQHSKPNYEYAMPERRYLFDQMSSGLASIRTAEAHMFLRHHDVELPPQATT